MYVQSTGLTLMFTENQQGCVRVRTQDAFALSGNLDDRHAGVIATGNFHPDCRQSGFGLPAGLVVSSKLVAVTELNSNTSEQRRGTMCKHNRQAGSRQSPLIATASGQLYLCVSPASAQSNGLRELIRNFHPTYRQTCVTTAGREVYDALS